MNDISMSRLCRRKESDSGYDLSLFMPYLQAKALLLQEPFSEILELGVRTTIFSKDSERAEIISVHDNVSDYYGAYIDTLPKKINGRLLYELISETSVACSLDAEKKEKVSLCLEVTKEYIDYLNNRVSELKQIIAGKYVGILEKVFQLVLMNKESYLTINDIGPHIGWAVNSWNDITFKSFGMAKLDEFVERYAFGMILTEYANEKDSVAKYTLLNAEKLLLEVRVQIDKPEDPKLIDWV